MKKSSYLLAAVLSLALPAITVQAANLDTAGNSGVATATAPLTRAQVVEELKLAYKNREIPSLEVLYHFPALDRASTQAGQQPSSQGQPVAVVSPQEEHARSTTR